VISIIAFWVSEYVGVRAAKPVAWGIAIASALLLLSVAKCTYDGRVVDRHETKATTKTLRVDTAAKDEAATQRATDKITINQAEKERKDAIHAKPSDRPDAARTRLNCDRLRRAGFDTASFAECR
jgi:hypothetical protein